MADEKTDDRPECPRLTEDEIRKLAGRIIRNEVYLGIDEQSLESFRALIMLAGNLPAQTGAVWEEIHKAGPLSVNGLPMFLSIGGMVHVEDCNLLTKTCREMLRATGADIPSEEEIERHWREQDEREQRARDAVEAVKEDSP